VLTDIEVRYNGFEAFDVEPARIPDLFAQRPVVIFGKWDGKADGSIVLTGTGGNGRFEQSFDVTRLEPSGANRALRYLWARTRISRLSDFTSVQEKSENKPVITALGLQYNLLTDYTSFIAVQQAAVNPEGGSKDVTQPLPLPQGVSTLAVGGACSQVPEPEMIWVIAVMLGSLAVCLVSGLVRRQHQGGASQTGGRQ